MGSDEGDENTRKLKFLSRFDVEDDTLLVRWEPSSGEYSIVTAGVGLKNLILEVLADAGEPMKAAAVLAQLPMQDDGSAYDVGAVRARLADAAKAGQIAIAGKAGNANLYQINDRTPLVQ